MHNSGGYEKLYKHFQEIFEWEQPAYNVFTQAQFEEMTLEVGKMSDWFLGRDVASDALAPHLKAIVQSGPRTKPFYLYSNSGHLRIVMPQQKVDPVPWRRQEGELVGPVSMVKLSAGQMNLLRSMYLSLLASRKAHPDGHSLRRGKDADGAGIREAGANRWHYGVHREADVHEVSRDFRCV